MSDLTISNLSKSFGSHVALRDISIDVASGEFICLLGGSGCGKTTLLRLIAGLETHDTGALLLGGKDLTQIPSHKRNIGMVFQSLALFPHLNVGDNVAYGMRIASVPKIDAERRVIELLEMVGLPGLANRSVSALSGGQRQRVAIARALALKPDVFLMDEPFSALDAGLRDQMQEEVKRIQRDLGVTTIFVTTTSARPWRWRIASS
jgi:putative spermidine/putrescine transport system ATP-binding protein